MMSGGGDAIDSSIQLRSSLLEFCFADRLSLGGIRNPGKQEARKTGSWVPVRPLSAIALAGKARRPFWSTFRISESGQDGPLRLRFIPAFLRSLCDRRPDGRVVDVHLSVFAAAGLPRYRSNQSASWEISFSMPSQPCPAPFLTTSFVSTPTLFIFLTNVSDC